jgi:hypothetical protein
MMNFKTFFENNNITNIKLASNPRHRTEAGITNQKTNIVARYHSPHNDYNNQSVVKASYNTGLKKISEAELQKIINDYSLNLDKRDKTQPFEIALKQKNEQTGIGRFLVYDPQNGYSIQMKKA